MTWDYFSEVTQISEATENHSLKAKEKYQHGIIKALICKI